MAARTNEEILNSAARDRSWRSRMVQPSGTLARSKPFCRWLNLGRVEALQWVREQGIVLQSAKGPVPNLADWVAGEPIRGSWWGHPAGHEIFVVLGQVLASDDVVATRLINGKVTLVHCRLWPALVRVADRFPPARLAAVGDEHTATGAHRRTEIPFPEWVPAAEVAMAAALTIDEAFGRLPSCLR